MKPKSECKVRRDFLNSGQFSEDKLGFDLMQLVRGETVTVLRDDVRESGYIKGEVRDTHLQVGKFGWFPK